MQKNIRIEIYLLQFPCMHLLNLKLPEKSDSLIVLSGLLLGAQNYEPVLSPDPTALTAYHIPIQDSSTKDKRI